jgi:hypothetical protein
MHLGSGGTPPLVVKRIVVAMLTVVATRDVYDAGPDGDR